jgi:hypothetical protein
MKDYAALQQFCETDRQTEIIKNLIDTDSLTKTGVLLGISRQAVQNTLKTIKKKARLRGWDPEADMTRPGGEGIGLKRVSTNYDEDGAIRQQWVIFEPGKEEQGQQLIEFLEGLKAEIKPTKKSKVPKGKFKKDLLSAIVIGDGHLGMLADKEDNLDEEFNIEIATADLCAAIDFLVDSAPNAEEGMLVNVGDFLHHDDTKNRTPGHGNPLDVCTRHPKALRIAGATLRYCIDRMADRFKKVRVINAAGNHDPGSAIALSMFLEGVYEKDPRIIVEPTHSKFYFLEFGVNLIGVTHGDQIPANRLAGVMTRLASEMWGRTKYRRWWVGHIHHKQKLALDAGCTVESFNTLAGTDAWHAASGYGGERGIEMITLHKEFGEIARLSPSLEMIRAYN